MDTDNSQDNLRRRKEEYFVELLRNRIASLENGSSPFTKKELFLDICEYASDAYTEYDIPFDPDEGLEDEDLILENAAAGLLLGFLLRCLKRYANEVKVSDKLTTTATREELAKAFCLNQVNVDGKPLRGAPRLKVNERAAQFFEDGRFIAEMRACSVEECNQEGLTHAFSKVYGREFEALPHQLKQMETLREWCLATRN